MKDVFVFREWEKEGITLLVSLLEDDQIQKESYRKVIHSLPETTQFISFPIEDYSVPSSLKAVEDLVRRLSAETQRGNLMIHCWGGHGRTGLISACFLILHQKLSASESLEKIREVNPGAVETREQELFVERFENHVKEGI